MAKTGRNPEAASPSPGGDLETTASLILRIQAGDLSARDRLVERFLGPLQRWARGRLPSGARDLTDTDDLVQVTFLSALDHVKDFEPRREGAFLAFLRRILINKIRDQIRRAQRRPAMESVHEQIRGHEPSPLENAIGSEALGLYEKGLTQLTPEQQEAIILRIELGFTWAQVAETLGCPSPNAARMLVSRALVRLAEVMDGK